MLKRPDIRHSDGRQLGIVARDLGGVRVVYFVAYVKRHGLLHVISIRYAETDEEHASIATTLDDPADIRRTETPANAAATPTDADAQRALAWLVRGKPQAEIVHDDAVPAQDKADLASFRAASYRRKKG